MATICKRVYYEGKVQGVGFRYTARQVAREYDISGVVMNLPDGRVELLVEGETSEVDAFLLGIRESVLSGHIKKENSEDCALQGFRGFQIIA